MSATRRHSPIFIKLFVGFAVVILFSISILGLMVQRQIEDASLRNIRTNLTHQAYILQQTFAFQTEIPILQLQRQVATISASIEARITLIDRHGVVLADSEFNPQKMDNHHQRPEIQAAKLEGIGESRRFSTTLNTTMQYVALPSLNATNQLGYIRTALSTKSIDEEINYLRRVIIIATSLTAIIALFVGYWLAMSFAQPLRQMTLIANNFAQGRYQLRIPSHRRDEIGDLARSLNQMADISAQRFNNLASERDLLETILKSMNEGVITVDNQGVIQHINAAAARMLRNKAERCLGQTLKQIEETSVLHKAWKKCLDHQSSYKQQIQLRGYAFARHYQLHVSPLKESRNDGAILVLQDVTEVQRIDRMRADFVANASHELKTPITAIRGFAETLLDGGDVDAKLIRRFMRKIHSQSLRLSDLVSDLLALSRLESNDEAFEKTVDIMGITAKVCANLQAVAQSQEISLKLHAVKDKVLPVLGDDKALNQLVTNLVDNAIKYTPAGGQVDVYLQQHEQQILFAVEDTGIGIAPADQERIFERFYRVDKARSREVGGTGLGLAIVKHIVQSHQGKVQVLSDLERGTRFEVRLPITNTIT
ncbi:MAG: ATP-binding protein [Gammaproteobacteria bacterium]|nr:ATP-binding protein [Gammaproteobacteria bacterium]